MIVTRDDGNRWWTAQRMTAMLLQVDPGTTTLGAAARAQNCSPPKVEDWSDDPNCRMEHILQPNPYSCRASWIGRSQGPTFSAYAVEQKTVAPDDCGLAKSRRQFRPQVDCTLTGLYDWTGDIGVCSVVQSPFVRF
jgi:hypothetical protein